MGCKLLRASAPGSVMISGEHAVLNGKQAIVAAITPRISITLMPRQNKCIRIVSPGFGEYTTDITCSIIEPPFQYVLAAIEQVKPQLRQGFDLTIVSDFSHELGLGSSAAVTVAMVGVLYSYIQQELDPMTSYQKAREVITQLHPHASATDIAASTFGGLLTYYMEPANIEPIQSVPSIHLIYTGYKTVTQEVVVRVKQTQQTSPETVEKIFNRLHKLSLEIKQALQQQAWHTVGELFSLHQKEQQILGVSCPISDRIIQALQQMPTIYGAKISGSGLGDCVLAIGELPAETFPQNEEQAALGIKQISLAISQKGLDIAK